MVEVLITKFKAHCAELLEKVRKTGKPFRVTHLGKPVADVVSSPTGPKIIPIEPAFDRKAWFGSMKGKIRGDIISPAGDPEDWEVLRD